MGKDPEVGLDEAIDLSNELISKLETRIAELNTDISSTNTDNQKKRQKNNLTRQNQNLVQIKKQLEQEKTKRSNLIILNNAHKKTTNNIPEKQGSKLKGEENFTPEEEALLKEVEEQQPELKQQNQDLIDEELFAQLEKVLDEDGAIENQLDQMGDPEKGQVLVLSLDADGCLFGPPYHAKKSGDVRNKPTRNSHPINSFDEKLVLEVNAGFISNICDRIANGNYKKVVIMVGSNRQGFDMDVFNAQGHGTESIFRAISAITDKIVHELNKHAQHVTVELDKYLLADSQCYSEPGDSFDSALEIYNGKTAYEIDLLGESYFPRTPFEENKILILYAQMHKIASLNSEGTVFYEFYDDRDEDILPTLRDTFNQYKDLIPHNVELRLYTYKGVETAQEFTTEDGSPVLIKGTGKIDYKYHEKGTEELYNALYAKGDRVIMATKESIDKFLTERHKPSLTDNLANKWTSLKNWFPWHKPETEMKNLDEVGGYDLPEFTDEEDINLIDEADMPDNEQSLNDPSLKITPLDDEEIPVPGPSVTAADLPFFAFSRSDAQNDDLLVGINFINLTYEKITDPDSLNKLETAEGTSRFSNTTGLEYNVSRSENNELRAAIFKDKNKGILEQQDLEKQQKLLNNTAIEATLEVLYNGDGDLTFTGKNPEAVLVAYKLAKLFVSKGYGDLDKKRTVNNPTKELKRKGVNVKKANKAAEKVIKDLANEANSKLKINHDGKEKPFLSADIKTLMQGIRRDRMSVLNGPGSSSPGA